ncbi:hypothetical protein PGT21_005946 [Puccinia graminis f. sp. tritici]|uniref:Uncharacterized protein n=1 Tax=Puccinia graminis f. sp. tritici TaxID=56615 RepID=A0A5B0MJN2_PUCGR|nr:hypothetical protein PGT21_005946 [Puccinia graminis f. sp. tritici]
MKMWHQRSRDHGWRYIYAHEFVLMSFHLHTNSGCRSGRIQQPQPKPEIGAKLRWADSGSSLKLTSTELSTYNKELLLYNDSSLELLFSLQLAPQSDLHRCTTPTDISVFELGYMRRLS